MKNFDLPIEGMTCASCVTRVEKAIGKIDGVKNVNVNLATERVNFEIENDNIDVSLIANAVKEYGYELKLESTRLKDSKNEIGNVHPEEKDDFYNTLKKDFFFAIILTIPIFAISMLMDYHFFQNIWPFSHDYTRKILLILTTPIIFISGKRFYKVFWTNLKHFSAEMNSLVAIGTSSAYGYSVLTTLFPETIAATSGEPHVYFETAAVIITLILMGRLLEHRAKRKTTGAIKKLIELRPKTATILFNGNEKQIPISELQKDQVVIIKPGGKIPADGIIITGSSAVDESMMTGESIPVEKVEGSKVIGGTINKNGSFNFQVTQIGDNSVLGQIIKLVEHAQATKPPIQKLVDKIAGIFVPIVISIAIVTFIGWLIFSPEHSFNTALVNFVAVLIIACPCALGLATPTAIIVGTGMGALNGILIRNGESIELAHKISTIIFDKTGTITEGKPSVTEVVTFDIEENELLQLTASLESKSEHPLASAITEKAKLNSIPLFIPETFMNYSGFGISGVVNGKTVVVGNINLMSEFSIKLDNALTMYENLTAKGKTVICTAIKGILMGLIVIEDKVKDSSRDAIKKLNQMNIQTIMLTGDNYKTAESIASQVGIKKFISEVLPKDKSRIVEEYQQRGETVAMIGDGINDAPALAQADVGIAVGIGTDVAIETAQITLVQGNLMSVAKAINLSNNTLKTIKQNLFWAFIYNVVLIPLAALGYLNPMIAAFAMSLSSVSVVTNSLRLKRKRI